MKPALALLLVPLVLLSLFAACGDDDDSDPPTRDTTTLASSDEVTIDAAIEAAVTALEAGDIDALKAMASERLQDRAAQFDDLADCVPLGQQMTVKSRQIRPGRDGGMSIHIVFEVPHLGGLREARRDWRFVKVDAWLLDEIPQCPFSNRANATEPPSDAATDGASETIPVEETETPAS